MRFIAMRGANGRGSFPLKSGKMFIKSVGNFIKNNLVAAIDVVNTYLSMTSAQYAQATIGARIASKGDGTEFYGTIPAWTATNWEVELDVIFPTTYPGTQGVATWTQHTTPADNNWISVAWSPELGLFAAVAETGTNRVMTSPDGVTWTLRTADSDANGWRAIVWIAELGLFVAVANAGTNRAMSSPDGITWTARTPAADNNWQSLAWSPSLGLLVAVGDSGTGNRIMTSTNGTTWTAQTSPQDSSWISIVWAPELTLFVAVASSGTNKVMTSPDGINWTLRVAANSSTWASVTWSPELGIFFAVASSGTNRGMYSSDGITWTVRVPGLDTQFRRVIWAPELNLFLATATVATGTNIVTSLNGVTWTSRSFFPTTNQWRGLVWAPELGIFVAVANSGTGLRAMTSGALNTLLSGPVASNKFMLGTDTNTGDIITFLKGGATLQLDGATITKNIVPHPVDGLSHRIKLSSATSPITIDRVLHMTRSGFYGTATVFNLRLTDLDTPANCSFYPMDETIAGATFADTGLRAQDGTWVSRAAGDVITVYPDALEPADPFWIACKFRLPVVEASKYLMSLGNFVSGGSSFILRTDAANKLVATRANNTSAINSATYVALTDNVEYTVVVAVAADGSMTMYVNDIGNTATAAAGTAFATFLNWINLNGAKTTDGASSTRTAIDFFYAFVYTGAPTVGEITAILAGGDPNDEGVFKQVYNLAGDYTEVNGGPELTPYGSPTFGP